MKEEQQESIKCDCCGKEKPRENYASIWCDDCVKELYWGEDWEKEKKKNESKAT